MQMFIFVIIKKKDLTIFLTKMQMLMCLTCLTCLTHPLPFRLI